MKTDPEALQNRVLRPQELAEPPVDWPAIFGRAAPLTVELGFGNGEYLAWRAARQPERDFVGLELPFECLIRAARLLHQRALDNVRLVRGDARFLLRELFPPASVAEVVMQFPMPWPRQRQAKHRVMGPSFVATLAGVLQPGGRFSLASDQEWYVEEARRALSAEPAFAAVERSSGAERPFLSRYERKWLEEGRSSHSLDAVLGSSRAALRLIVPPPMLTVALEAAPADPRVAGLAGRRFHLPGLVAEVKEVFRNDQGWLMKAVSADAGFSQMYFLRLARRTGGGALLKVEECGRPYYTPAVRFLLESVAAELK